MEEKIKEVHNYFRDKIVKGEYEIVKPKEHHVDILIDGEYKFIIWWSNNDFGIETYDKSFMYLTFRQKDKKTIWSKLRKVREKYMLDVVLKDKEKLYKELKAQFESN